MGGNPLGCVNEAGKTQNLSQIQGLPNWQEFVLKIKLKGSTILRRRKKHFYSNTICV